MNNDLKRLAESLAQDVIRYQELGGDMNNLTAGNVYRFLNGKPPIEDLSYSSKIEKELTEFNPDKVDTVMDAFNNEIKNKLRPSLYEFLFKLVDSIDIDFDMLNRNQKIKFIKEGYKFIEITKTKIKEIPPQESQLEYQTIQ